MRRLRSLFRKQAREPELDREIRLHLEQHIASLMAAGVPSPEAERRASLEFGCVAQIKEECREARGFPRLESVIQDIRYGIRMLGKNRAFSAVAILSLALGIGANTAIFAVADALLFRMLPVRAPQELVSLALERSPDWSRWPYPFFLQLRDGPVFSELAASDLIERHNVAFHGEVDPGTVRVGLVSGNYFETLGVLPAAGRLIGPAEDRAPGASPVAVISYPCWESRFAKSPKVVDQTVTIGAATFTIIGVASPQFAGDWIGHPADLWIPATMQAQAMPEAPSMLNSPQAGWLRILGRLHPGIAAAQAQAALNVDYLRFEEAHFGPPQKRDSPPNRLELRPAGSGYAPERRGLLRPITILTIVAGLVLLIACANVANLLLARSESRRREISVRLAMGAARGRILRQWMTESVLLSLCGGVAGVLLSIFGAQVLLKMIATGLQPVFLDVHPDGLVLAFAIALSLLTGVLFSIGPAWRASQVPLSPALKGSSPRRVGRLRFGIGKALVISQVSLSLVLLAGAGLFIRTIRNLKSQDFGFDRGHLLVVWTAPGQTGRHGAALARLHEAIREKIAALPGVISASQSSTGLLNSNYYWVSRTDRLRVPGRAPRTGGRWTLSMAAPRYFETVGIPLLLGREFNERDTSFPLGSVAVINSALAKQLFEDANPIGQKIDLGNGAHFTPEIVGVASDARSVTPRDATIGMIYLPELPSEIGSNQCLVVRAAGSPSELAPRLRRALQDLEPLLPVLNIMTIEQQLDESLAGERMITELTAIFSTLALILACIGLYGVMSYTTSRRSSEIGIRLALGSTRAGVRRMVLGESFWVLAAGIVLGVLVARGASGLVSKTLYGVSPSDPLTIAAAILLMTAVSLLAAWIPAHRAARVDPVNALRIE